MSSAVVEDSFAATSMASSSTLLSSSNAMVASGCFAAMFLSALFLLQRERVRRQSGNSKGSKTSKGETIVDRTKYPGGIIHIYFATQTGTAEAFAQEVEREAADHGFLVKIVDIEEITTAKAFLTGDNKAIVVASTYGEGEPTDNANALVQVLKETILEDPASSSLLTELEYCVFGLGNRQYEHFNAMGRFFDDTLEKLGASRIMDIGLGDDDVDLEGDFENWKETLWTTLKDKYCGDSVVLPTKRSSESKLPECEYAVELHPAHAKTDFKMSLDHVHGSSRPYFLAESCPVTKIKELRSEQDGGSAKHMEIDLSRSKIKYETADNLGVLPLNSTDVVESVANALGYDLDQMFSIQAAPGHEWHGAPFPMPLSIRDCLTRYLDLTSAPRRSDLKLLAQYATDPIDRQALLRLSSKEGKSEYKTKITDAYVGMVDLLKLCPSLTIPLEHMISICHFLLPRFYTIASSSSVHPKSVHLTVAVTQHERLDGSKFEGICSTHLARRNNGEAVAVFNRASTFRLPKDPSIPILMIGPGTGVAPMRALLQERQHQKTKLRKNVGPNVLYFGCKKASLDYLYQDEMADMERDGLVKLYVAFSRAQKEKVYVQHLLKQNGSETWDLIDKGGAYIYVCGGVKMGHDVTEALKEIVSSQGGLDPTKAKDYLQQLASQGRFVQELWA